MFLKRSCLTCSDHAIIVLIRGLSSKQTEVFLINFSSCRRAVVAFLYNKEHAP